MEDYRDILTNKETTLFEALEQINKHASYTKTIFVVDDNGIALGSLSDGDIRRALIAGISLQEPVHKTMNKNFISIESAFPRNNAYERMREHKIQAIPVIDKEGRIKQVILESELKQVKQKRKNTVLLVAGGLGQRLLPLTEVTPKPMLAVGNKPILENIVDRLVEQGFSNLVLSVNYKAEQIKNYFGDGSSKGVCITYLEEKERLGTAGSINLFSERPTEPFIVCNADLLTKVNFNIVLDWHDEYNSVATMCVRSFDYEIPYGVVQFEKHKIQQLIEKPRYSYWVNAGIYVLNPETIDYIPKGYFDMTNLFEKLIQQNLNVCSFPIGAYWLDIGQKIDYEQANKDYNYHFDVS